MKLLMLVPAAMLGALILGLCVRRPVRTILPVYVALVPFGDVFSLRVPLPSPFNSLSSVVGALTIVALVLHLLLERRGRVPSLPVGLWFAFVAWGALTVLWAQDPTIVVKELSVAAPLLMLLLLVAIVPVTIEELQTVRTAIVLSGAGVGAYGLLLIVAGKGLPAHGLTDRFSISANPSNTNPNQLAAALLLPLILSIGLVLEGREPDAPTWRPWVGGACAVLTAFAMGISGSRGGALAAAVGFVVLLILWYRWRPWQRYRVRRVFAATAIGGITALVLAALVIVLFPQGKFATVASGPLQRLTETSSSSGRAEIWTTGGIACRTYCGFGAGMGNFPIVYSNIVAFSDVTRNVGLQRPGHNLYLEIVVEMGVVGFLLFWLAIAGEWRSLHARRVFPIAPAIAVAIVAILLADFFEAFLWFKHAWLPFMMIRLLEGAYATDPLRDAVARFRPPAAVPSAGVVPVLGSSIGGSTA